jgi:hypothetical protein
LLFQDRTEYTRITKKGIQYAIADMMLLGKTIEMFGGKKTTFLSAVRSLYEVFFFPSRSFFPSLPTPNTNADSCDKKKRKENNYTA